MARDRITPINQADELLRSVLIGKNAEALEVLRPHVSAAIAEGLSRVIEGLAVTEELRQLAEARGRVINRLSGEGNVGDPLPCLDDGPLRVISAFSDPEGFAALAARHPTPGLDEDPTRDPGFTKRHFLRSHQIETLGLAEDYSFFVVDGQGLPLLRVECDARGDLYLGCRETGIALMEMAAESRELEAARTLALRQLDGITAWIGCPYYWLDLPAGVPTPPGAATVIPYRLGWIELEQDQAAIERAYRPTTRQRLRWGHDNVRVAGGDDPGIDVQAAYAELHRRIDRDPGLPPEVLSEALSRGDIAAQLGYYQDALVGMVLTSRHGRTTYDMATMNVRIDNLPLGHVLIHHAILDAKARGQRRFHFGPLYESGHFGAKMKSIAEFKRGFAGLFEARMLLKLGE
jgi:hypothetical protein